MCYDPRVLLDSNLNLRACAMCYGFPIIKFYKMAGNDGCFFEKEKILANISTADEKPENQGGYGGKVEKD